jgi:putative glutamine amidotransferase
MARPKILVTLDTGEDLRKGVPFPSVHMKAAYARAIEDAGGTPILAAPTRDAAIIAELLDLLDGLVITGGAFDIDPTKYGAAQTSARIDTPKPLRTDFEQQLCEGALARNVPVLGICGGMQLLNVVLGGTLVQDITTEVPNALEHEQPTSPAEPFHAVNVVEGTAFHRAIQKTRIEVNTTHHQAVKTLGRGLAVLGTSPDGVIEVIGRTADLSITGVQWHPELLDDAVSRVLYGALVEHAKEPRRR